MPSSVTDLVQRLVDRVAAADPIVATQLGMVEHAGELPDLSAPALAAYVADARRLLGLLDDAAAGAAGAAAIDAVTGGQIARRVLRSFETRRVQQAKPGLYLDAAYGVLLLMIKEVGTPAERVEAMAGRLRALPGVLEEGLANLRAPLPSPFVATALADVPGVTELVGEAAPRAAAELGFAGALDGPARLAAAAVTRFGDELRARYLPTATSAVAGGRELLVDLLAHEHLLDETPEQIAAVGRAAMADTRAAMDELAARHGTLLYRRGDRRGAGRPAHARRVAGKLPRRARRGAALRRRARPRHAGARRAARRRGHAARAARLAAVRRLRGGRAV